ncbi:hypothetical protein ACFL5K_02995 [Gemmatimonadota bacterium]
MAEENDKKNGLPEPERDELLEDSTPDEDTMEEEPGVVEESSVDSREPEDEQVVEEQPDSEQESVSSSVKEQFVDFDVWLATLEANFGPDFEKVLQQHLGPDWNAQIDKKMMSGEIFHRVVQDIKKGVEGTETEEDLDTGEMTFQTMNSDGGFGGPGGGGPGGGWPGGPGRGGPGGGGPGGGGPGGGGPGGAAGADSVPLADLHRKEFKTQDKFKLDTRPDDFEYEKVLRYKGDKENKDPQDEVVLMDRGDFSKLSYYAQKEKERHHDDLTLQKVLKRDSSIRLSQYRKTNLLLASVAGIVFLYTLFCLVSYFACSVYSRSLVKSLSPDLVFRPSTTMHKQGELAGFNPSDPEKQQPLIYYILRPSLKKLDLTDIGSGGRRRFELAVCGSSLIVVPRGLSQDSLTVRKYYNQSLPQNLGGVLRLPFVTLTEEKSVVLQAYETVNSSLLPGLLQLEILDGQGLMLGRAYLSGDWLNISIEKSNVTSGVELQALRSRLVLLFSLLQL